MAFSLTVKNVGDTGTIQVWQKINLNEQKQLLDQIIEAGESVQITAVGTPPQDFAWQHNATNTIDQGSYGAGDTIEVRS